MSEKDIRVFYGEISSFSPAQNTTYETQTVISHDKDDVILSVSEVRKAKDGSSTSNIITLDKGAVHAIAWMLRNYYPQQEQENGK